jgi:hypothetical protein
MPVGVAVPVAVLVILESTFDKSGEQILGARKLVGR